MNEKAPDEDIAEAVVAGILTHKPTILRIDPPVEAKDWHATMHVTLEPFPETEDERGAFGEPFNALTEVGKAMSRLLQERREYKKRIAHLQEELDCASGGLWSEWETDKAKVSGQNMALTFRLMEAESMLKSAISIIEAVQGASLVNHTTQDWLHEVKAWFRLQEMSAELKKEQT